MCVNDSEQLPSGGRDRPLSGRWLATGLARELGLPRSRNAEHAAARASILAEALLGEESGRAVSYSRNRNYYSNSRRYRGAASSYASVLASIEELDQAGYIIDRRVPR